MTALVITAIIGCIVLGFVTNRSQRKRIELALSSIAAKLDDGAYDIRTRVAWGDLGGASVRLQYVVRGSGDSAERWTEIQIAVPPQYPLRLFVRKQGWRDAGRVERGELVDVIVGDPAFDDRFLVEAAPAEVARRLFDARECSYLLALFDRRPFEITSAPGTIDLALRSWVTDLGDLAPALEAMVAIGGRLRDAYADVEHATAARDVGTPYRPMLDDTAAKAAADARLAEIMRIDELHAARAARQKLMLALFMVVWVTIAVLGIATH